MTVKTSLMHAFNILKDAHTAAKYARTYLQGIDGIDERVIAIALASERGANDAVNAFHWAMQPEGE